MDKYYKFDPTHFSVSLSFPSYGSICFPYITIGKPFMFALRDVVRAILATFTSQKSNFTSMYRLHFIVS